MASTSELRGVAVFASYLLVAGSLSAFIITAISRAYASLTPQATAKVPKRRLGLFVLLATASVGLTWFYMFAFFLYSYQDWLRRAHPAFLGSPDPKDLTFVSRALQLVGLARPLKPEPVVSPAVFMSYSIKDTVISFDLFSAWLRDTALFRQAWESACSSLPRYWWSHQIFGVTAAWSFFLGWHGKRRAIVFAPLFMLLAQTVAVSFAMNLFFLALLVSPAPKSPASEEKQSVAVPAGTKWQFAPWLVLASNAICVALMPFVTYTAYFMPALLIPHLLLFAPAFGCGISRKSLPALLSASLHTALIALAVNTWILLVAPNASGKAALFSTVKLQWARQQHHAVLGSSDPATTIQLFSMVQRLLAPLLVYFNVLESFASLAMNTAVATAREFSQEALQNPMMILSRLASLLPMFGHREKLLVSSLFSHPAVASVGFDTLLCWISIMAWVVTDESVWHALIGEA